MKKKFIFLIFFLFYFGCSDTPPSSSLDEDSAEETDLFKQLDEEYKETGEKCLKEIKKYGKKGKL